MQPVWNVCLTHDPMSAGLYRSIGDFARGLDAAILSFDDGRRDRHALTAADGARRIACGRGWFTRDCHRLPRATTNEAERLVGNARLLVVHSLFRAHAPWAAGWARRRGSHYWSVPHGCLDPWGLSRRRLAKRLWLEVHGRRYFAEAERIVFSTQREREKARPWLGGPRGQHWLGDSRRDQAVVVNWPVDTPALDGRDQARGRHRRRLGISDDAPILLAVGRLHSMKRPLETIAAFCDAAAPESHLVMVGMDGDLAAADVARAVPPAWHERVHVAGELAGPDLADAYLASDGYISLSHRENFGYAAAEAVAYGLPVILSPGHDLAHEMPGADARQFACGWLLPDDSHATAVQAIREWVGLVRGSGTAATRLVTMAATGRAWAAERLSFDRFATTLATLASGT